MQSLFSSTCNICPAFGVECPGERPLSCGCVRTKASYKECGSCRFVCRERVDPAKEEAVSFIDIYREGLGFDQVSFNRQEFQFVRAQSWLPLIDRPGSMAVVDPKWSIAISLNLLEGLFSPRSTQRDRTHALRAVPLYNHTGDKTLLLHGKDSLLEKFAPQVDRNFFERITALGITQIIGPGFSMYSRYHSFDQTPAGVYESKETLRPEFTNVMAARQQLAVLQLAHNCGLEVVPILNYSNTTMKQAWGEMIRKQVTLRAVAFDFSMVKRGGPEFDDQLLSHCELLEFVNRPLVVYLIGAGESNYTRIAEAMKGPQYSLVSISSSPFYRAYRTGQRAKLSATGVQWESSSETRDALAKMNVQTIKSHFDALAVAS